MSKKSKKSLTNVKSLDIIKLLALTGGTALALSLMLSEEKSNDSNASGKLTPSGSNNLTNGTFDNNFWEIFSINAIALYKIFQGMQGKQKYNDTSSIQKKYEKLIAENDSKSVNITKNDTKYKFTELKDSFQKDSIEFILKNADALKDAGYGLIILPYGNNFRLEDRIRNLEYYIKNNKHKLYYDEFAQKELKFLNHLKQGTFKWKSVEPVSYDFSKALSIAGYLDKQCQKNGNNVLYLANKEDSDKDKFAGSVVINAMHSMGHTVHQLIWGRKQADSYQKFNGHLEREGDLLTHKENTWSSYFFNTEYDGDNRETLWEAMGDICDLMGGVDSQQNSEI